MEIASLILNFILGTGLIGTLVFFRSKQRKESASADMSEVEVKKAEFDLEEATIESLTTRLQHAYEEIENMQSIINKKRAEILEIMRQTKALEIELINEKHARNIAEAEAKQLREHICFRDCPHREVGGI